MLYNRYIPENKGGCVHAKAATVPSDLWRATSRYLLPQHISSAREAVARMLKSFSEDVLVELKRGEITLRDKNRLNRLKLKYNVTLSQKEIINLVQ